MFKTGEVYEVVYNSLTKKIYSIWEIIGEDKEFYFVYSNKKEYKISKKILKNYIANNTLTYKRISSIFPFVKKPNVDKTVGKFIEKLLEQYSFAKYLPAIPEMKEYAGENAFAIYLSKRPETKGELDNFLENIINKLVNKDGVFIAYHLVKPGIFFKEIFVVFYNCSSQTLLNYLA